jgi:L-amino acid N-acyltransferase
MQKIHCDEKRHSAAILDILNDAILTSTALYDYKPRTIESMATWFAVKVQNNFPVHGLESDSGELMGFASYGTFRAFPAYKYTIEHSIYVHKNFRGKGLGAILLEAIIQEAQDRNVHVMVGGIDASNATSIALHEKFGFSHSGTIKEAGFKFGRWLDLAFYQKVLLTPETPIDG